MLQIPKIIGHIWVGYLQAPEEWMQTWRDYHPTWEYRLYDNEYLFSRRWKNQELINAFSARKEYAGVSDLMRYEIWKRSVVLFQRPIQFVCVQQMNCGINLMPLIPFMKARLLNLDWFHLFLASAPNHPIFPYLQERAKRRNDPA